MKKFLFFALLLIAATNCAQAQSANLTVINNTDWTIDVTVYGYAPSYCSTGTCSTTYQTIRIHLVPYGWPLATQTFGPSDPCAVSTSPGFLTPLCTTPWCSSLPSDFQWTYASIDMYNDVTHQPASTYWTTAPFPIIVEDAGIGCTGSGASYGTYNAGTGLYPHLDASWTTTGGSLADVTISVIQW